MKNVNSGEINANRDVRIGDNIINKIKSFVSVNINVVINLFWRKKKQKYTLPKHLKSFPHYINRIFTSLESKIDWQSKPYNIYDIINKKGHAVILGSPGIGKTSQLVSLVLSVEKLNNEYTAVYKNFRNFTVAENIIQYLELDRYHFDKSLLLVLDGIDEISNIKDFILKLDEFLNSYSEYEFQLVLSCRENVYRGILNSKIESFSPYYIEPLRIKDIAQYLKDKYNIELDFALLDQTLIEFIKVPFQLEIFAEYYIESFSLPTSTYQLWAAYIVKRIEKDIDEKFKSEDDSRLFKINLLKYNKILAFVKELSGEQIDDIKLYKLIPDDFSRKFQKSPFTFVEDNIWNFEYKIVQEHFVANLLSELSWENLKEIIFIESLNRIRPNLYNAVSHLFEILSVKENKNTYDNLYNHLKENEIKLFFDIGSEFLNRELRLDIFKTYYHREFVVKELFTHYEELRKLGRFANFPETFEFLFDIFRNEIIYNEEVRKNALNLLAYIDIPLSQEKVMKDYIIYLIKSNICRLSEWSHIFTYLEKSKLKNDREFIDSIIEIYNNNISEDFGHYLSGVIFNIENKDSYIEFIESEFDYYLGDKDRKRETSVNYSQMALDLMATMLNSENTLRILPFYLCYNSKNYFRTTAEQFFKKIEKFIQADNEFLYSVLDTYVDKKAYEHEFLNYGILHLTIRNSGKILESINYLHSKYDLPQFSDLIAKWITSQTLEKIIEVVFDKKHKEEDQRRFYYHIGFNDTEGYIIFKTIEDKAVENGLITERRKNPLEQQSIADEIKEHKQKEFNKLFNISLIIEEVEAFFSDHNLENISTEKFYKIERELLEQGNHDQYEWQRINSRAFRQIISNILQYHRQNSIALNALLDILKSEKILYFTIKDIWEKNQWIVFLDSQKEWIQSKTAEFTDINSAKYEILDIQNGTYTYSLLSIVYFYRKGIVKLDNQYKYDLLKIHLPNELDSGTSLFEFIESENPREFRTQVISNMIEDKVKDKLALESHINYCIDNKISETFPIIENHILKLNIYRYDETLRGYYNIEKNDEFLKKCLEVYDLKFTALEILAQNSKYFQLINEECIKLTKAQSSFDYEYAVKLLFRMNDKAAFRVLIDYSNKYNNGKPPSYTQYNDEIANYNNIGAIEDFKEILELEDPDTRDPFSVFRTLHNVYLNNTCADKKNLDIICSILDSIIKERKEKGLSIFYFSQLKEHANSVYLNALNEPMSFADAKKLVEGLF